MARRLYAPDSGCRLDSLRARPIPPAVARMIESDPGFPKGEYARALLYGHRSLEWGGWYADVRARVIAVARLYDVSVVRTQPHGKLHWHAVAP